MQERPPDLALAYLAGLFDAKGGLYVAERGKLVLELNSVNPKSLEFAKTALQYGDVKERRGRYRYRIAGQHAHLFAEMIRPFLLIKGTYVTEMVQKSWEKKLTICGSMA